MDKLHFPDTRRVFASFCPNVLLPRDVTSIKCFLVCSADAGEGATAVAVGLTLAAAEHQTDAFLLMDGNFRRPAVLAALSKLSTNGCDQVELVLNNRIFPDSLMDI
jgi:Mrp family chromosome partitioning ATPase